MTTKEVTPRLSDEDRTVIEEVVERLESILDDLNFGMVDEVFESTAVCIRSLESLLDLDFREEVPHQYELPLAGGYMFGDEEEPLDFNRS